MILSGRDIAWYVEHGSLVIDPVRPDQFQQNGVDLILKDMLPRVERFGDAWGPLDSPSLPRFYLGGTLEQLRLPNDLMAFVELRSTWARQGLMLPPTIVDAGFTGNLTLEIVAFKDIEVPYGERFAHLIFARLSSPSLPYRGKYGGQHGVTPAIPDPERE